MSAAAEDHLPFLSMPDALAPYLCAQIHGLKLTAVETSFNLAFTGALVLGPRVAWAAGLAEFERVEVCNLVRCETQHLHILYGTEGKVEWWASASQRAQPGDTLRVSAHAWIDRDHLTGQSATFVLIGRQNAPIEIRRIAARRAKIDPSYCALPPLEDVTERSPAL